jgi:hypothetical protein
MKILLPLSGALFLFFGCAGADLDGGKITGSVYTGGHVLLGSLGGWDCFDVDGDGSLERIEVEQMDDNTCTAKDIWLGDGFTLKIEPHENKSFVPIEEEFISSYGMFTLEIYDLFHDNKGEIFLVYGIGRGTEVRGEILEIYKLENGKLITIFKSGISGFIYPGGHWQSRYSVADVNGDGNEDLVFITDYNFSNEYTDKEKEDILKGYDFLKDRITVYLWDKNKGEYVLSESK